MLIFVVAVFACIVAHEFGHVLVARVFGVTTPDITLYPFGGVARLNTIPQEPIQEFLIAIAGPAVNIIITAGLLILAGATLTPAALAHDQADLASRLATTNLVLAVFNLIPAFPMDGGRVLRAALTARLGIPALNQACRNSRSLDCACMRSSASSNPMLIVIALFILFAATAELQATSVRAFSKDLPAERAMISEFATLPAAATIADAVQRFLHTSQKVIPVIDESGKFAGVLEIGDVVRALHAQQGGSRPVADIMHSEIPTLSSRAKLDEAFRLMQEKAVPAVAIVDDDAGLKGLVTLETLGEMLLLHDASASVFDGMQSPGRKEGGVRPTEQHQDACRAASTR